MKLANIGSAAMLAAIAMGNARLENAMARIDMEDGFGAKLEKHGSVSLWNDSSLLEGATFQTGLTGYTVGWKDNEDLLGVGNFIAPPVQVERRFEYKSFNNVEQFLSDTSEDLRAINGKLKEVEIFQNTNLGQTECRGLAMRYDKDRVTPGWHERCLNTLMRRLHRNKLRRKLSALSAAATNTAKTWDTTAGKNPDQDVKTELITASDLTGVRPNAILYGDTAWDKRGIAYGAQNTAAGYGSFDKDIGEMPARLMVDNVMLSKARYSSSATARTQIVNNLVEMFYSDPGAGPDDSSTMKDFWTPTNQGGQFAVFMKESAFFHTIMIWHYELIKVTSTLGVRQFTIS